MKWLSSLFLILAVSCAQQTPVATATQPRSGDPAPKIASYCLAQKGRIVGNGECWTLANEAFKSSGARRPGSDVRVWGRVVDPTQEDLKPGDILEIESARFLDGTITGPNHTVVVVRGGSQESFGIAEQNWGRKSVRVREFNLKSLVSGKVKVYRPH
jgi:hypothetical protein